MKYYLFQLCTFFPKCNDENRSSRDRRTTFMVGVVQFPKIMLGIVFNQVCVNTNY